MTGVNVIPERDGQGRPFTRIAIEEEFYTNQQTATGGRYQARSYDFAITHAANTWADFDFSYPYPISIFSTEWINDPLFDGDYVRVLMAPDTITGSITFDVAVNDTVINVSQTVVDNARIGYVLALDDGTNYNDMGRVLAIDKDLLKVTMETPAANTFLAATPTYVKQTIEFIPHILLTGKGRVELAKDVVGGSYIPANTVMRVRYKNNEGTTTNKTFSFILEYKY